VRKLLKRIQAALTAAAFAEEGEADMARQVLAEAERGDETAAPGRRRACSFQRTKRTKYLN
jgi:hypothetical protein